MGAFDDPRGFTENVEFVYPVTLGSEQNPAGKIYVRDLVVLNDETQTGDEDITGNLTVGGTADVSGVVTAPTYNLEDGEDKNYPLSVYAAGTAYALTNTAAALNFGTTDPVLTIDKAGTYLLLARVNLLYNAATFAASRAVTLKLRRTNNTAADLTNGTLTAATDIITTLTYTFGVFDLPRVIYTTTNDDDAITIYGDVATVPTAGSLDAVAAEIVAIRLY